MTQINDRWQTFTEVNTTVDLVFQHNQRLICYRLKFLSYMYIIFLYLFIKNVAISLKVLFIWVISRTHNIQKKKSHDMNFIFLGGVKLNFKASIEKLIAIFILVFIFLKFSYTAVRFWNILYFYSICVIFKKDLPASKK